MYLPPLLHLQNYLTEQSNLLMSCKLKLLKTFLLNDIHALSVMYQEKMGLKSTICHSINSMIEPLLRKKETNVTSRL